MSSFLIHTALWGASLFVLAASARADLRERIVPNESVIVIAACGLALTLVSRPEAAWLSLSIAALLLLGLLTLAHYDLLGAGDAKLIAAVTFLVPPDRVGLLLVEIALAGGFLSAAYLAAHHALKRAQLAEVEAVPIKRTCAIGAFDRLLRIEQARIVSDNSVPYALAVLGGVSFYIASELYQCLFATSCSL
jgi:prepilin peptidase CpaA